MAAVFGIAVVIAVGAALIFLAIALATALVGLIAGIMLAAMTVLVVWRIALRKKYPSHDRP